LYEIIGITPFEFSDPNVVAAVCRAGALGVLDVGRDRSAMRAAFDRLAQKRIVRFGVRVSSLAGVSGVDLPEAAQVVITDVNGLACDWGGRELLVQVTSLAQARSAIARGAAGLIAKGAESGGEVAEQMAFVLLQQLREALGDGVRIYGQGGVGVHTAAACIAGGAIGVVIDSQLALVRESSLPAAIKAAIHAMDASDTTVIAGHRVLLRPDLPTADAAGLDADSVRARLGGSDLHRDFVPAGQDGALARPLADRYRTAGGVIAALRDGLRAHLRAARATDPLGPGSAFAAHYGLTYPICQGPMTRVSDRAEFADTVSAGGGLPFVALSLLRGDAVRTLVRETAERLGERCWGVGLLGFAPPELRAEQLAALADTPPPVALIAGGRPAQAKALEQRGTSTFVHAPSPGLLAMFLKDGLRKFVFEGRECGGHVGPRSSFVLWERVLERLLSFGEPETLELVFAGGIHDARSAAMVAAAAATLAERGARIAALMGTAYLFTREAVTTGAITANFQRNALACRDTVLLETAPGHATRCVRTDYVDAFEARKAELAKTGASAQTLWADLERLNLGRLRIASKGLRRDGGALVQVPEPEQQRDGMFMIGQVAALRESVCSVAELHADVSAGASRVVAALPACEPPAPEPEPADVAIVGMACVFPNAPDLASFWANIVGGDNAITEVPPERWNPDTYYDPEATGASAGRKTPSKWGGFLPEVDFDPLAYGIPPKSLAAIEPVQLLSLEVARRALADAGYAERPFARERASVIFGAEAGTELSGAYGFRASYPQLAGELPAALDDHLPTLTEDSFPGVLANVIAGRIANRLDLGGVNFTVDAACASSLVALDGAVKELVSNTSDMVLCGGADVHNSINDYLLFSSVHALSPRGECRSFDATADGIVLGEGVGCIVLKRLADAERDGDRIYAVVKGIAGSSDGRSLGLTAPRKEGQERALQRAYERCGVSPADVGMVEAHGTGTVVGDRTELATLTDVFAAAGAAPGGCTLGSVKSQIGHTKCAAGIAGLIKTALSLHAAVRPPTLNVESPNPGWQPESSPFEFSPTARPWPHERRHGAVSALGFGGTNFHAVLSAYDAAGLPEVGLDQWPAELLLLRGRDRDDAAARAARLADSLAKDTNVRLRDVAAALAAPSRLPVHIAVVASDLDDARDRLASAGALRADPRGVFIAGDEPAGKVAFVFPGQGSQRLHMLAELFIAFPRLQRLLRLGDELADIMFPGAAFAGDAAAAQKRALTDTRRAQPALGIADVAMAELLAAVGVQPDMLAGHSYGELVALCRAGHFGARELIELSRARARCILDAAGADPGTMAAVRADAVAVRAACAGIDGIVLANCNAPAQTVISGPTPAVEAAVAALKQAGMATRQIPVACAFHSGVVADAETALAEHLAGVTFAPARLPVWSNTTADQYPKGADAARALLASQVASPVRFVEQIEAMYAAGARTFVEVGPGRVLSGLIAQILGDRPHRAIATDAPGKSGVRQLLCALAQLATSGVAMDVSSLFVGRQVQPVDVDAALPAPAKTSWRINGYTARPRLGQLPAAAYKPAPQPVVTSQSQLVSPSRPVAHGAVSMSNNNNAPADASREAAVIEYMRTMREMVAAQRDVMLTYLGQPATAVARSVAVAPQVRVDAGSESDTDTDTDTDVEVGPGPDLQETLLAIVRERTGYPAEMLELDLNLEAELSIDSIKRIEILGELRDRVGLAVAGASEEEAIEQLAALKTLRGIIEWLQEHQEGEGPAADVGAETEEPMPVQREIALGRYEVIVEAAPAPALNGTTLDDRVFVITDDGRGVAARVAALLQSHGARAQILGADEVPGDVDGLIHLQGLAAGADPMHVKRLFRLGKRAAAGGAKWLVATTGLGGRFGHAPLPAGAGSVAGVAGLMKTFAREYSEMKLRLLDVDPAMDGDSLAASLVTELLVVDRVVEVGLADGKRYQRRVVAADAAGDAPALPLSRASVVLITGGARGITARAAIALAERYQCHLVLCGRSPLPGDPDPRFVSASDRNELRKLLVDSGMRAPKQIEAVCNQILGARQIRHTLAAIAAAGSRVDYYSVDVRDAAALGKLIDQLYRDHGRIAGVIHGAGVIEDKLIADKTDESFDRVFDTKVGAARVIAERVRSDIDFVAMFGSVSGVFGNRGQVDYAAANNAMDILAHELDRRIDGHAVSLDWGPWAQTGMVSAELEREYARRGVGLIDPADGIERLLAELAGSGSAQVVLMCASPAAMGMPATAAESREHRAA